MNVLHMQSSEADRKSAHFTGERGSEKQVICLRPQVKFWGGRESDMVSVELQEPSVELCPFLGHYFPKAFCGQSSTLGAGDAVSERSR